MGDILFKRALNITGAPSNIADSYQILEQIGNGSYGFVSSAQAKSTSTYVAVKHIVKAREDNQSRGLRKVKEEIAILNKLNHVNIIKLIDTFEDRKYIYLVLELCCGGTIHQRLASQGKFTESEASHVMHELLVTVDYLHELFIIHRDIKTENMLFLNADGEPIEYSALKLVDFGFASEFTPGHLLKEQVGSPGYVAPEVLTGQYNQLCDLWSCGVLLYVLLCGSLPFHAKTDSGMARAVLTSDWTFKGEVWDRCSPDAKDLVRVLMRPDPRYRFASAQALEHIWLQTDGVSPIDVVADNGCRVCCFCGV